VAEHPTTPGDALAALLPAEPSNWNDFALLATVARHAHADERLLRAIADRLGLHRLREDRDSQRVFEAGIALFEQPRTPEDVLLGLLNDAGATTEFRKVAARQTTHRAVVEQLLNDPSATVRRAAERRVSDL
jgi:hypothetical protein